MFLMTFSVYFQKACFFFDFEKLKKTISRKESKFHVITFINPPDSFFQKKTLLSRVMKTLIQKSNKEVK